MYKRVIINNMIKGESFIKCLKLIKSNSLSKLETPKNKQYYTKTSYTAPSSPLLLPSLLLPLPRLPTPTRSIQSIKNKCFVFDFDCTLTYSHWYYFIESFSTWLTFPKHDPIGNKLSEQQKNTLRQLSNNIAQWKIEFAKNTTNTKITEKVNTLSENDKNLIITYIMGGQERLTLIKTVLERFKTKFTLFIASRNYKINIKILLCILELNNLFKAINAKQKEQSITKDLYIMLLISQGYTEINYIDDDQEEHFKLIPKLASKNIIYRFFGLHNDAKSDYIIPIDLKKNFHGIDQKSITTIINTINNTTDNTTNSFQNGGKDLTHHKRKKYKNKYILIKNS